MDLSRCSLTSLSSVPGSECACGVRAAAAGGGPGPAPCSWEDEGPQHRLQRWLESQLLSLDVRLAHVAQRLGECADSIGELRRQPSLGGLEGKVDDVLAQVRVLSGRQPGGDGGAPVSRHQSGGDGAPVSAKSSLGEERERVRFSADPVERPGKPSPAGPRRRHPTLVFSNTLTFVDPADEEEAPAGARSSSSTAAPADAPDPPPPSPPPVPEPPDDDAAGPPVGRKSTDGASSGLLDSWSLMGSTGTGSESVQAAPARPFKSVVANRATRRARTRIVLFEEGEEEQQPDQLAQAEPDADVATFGTTAPESRRTRIGVATMMRKDVSEFFLSPLGAGKTSTVAPDAHHGLAAPRRRSKGSQLSSMASRVVMAPMMMMKRTTSSARSNAVPTMISMSRQIELLGRHENRSKCLDSLWNFLEDPETSVAATRYEQLMTPFTVCAAVFTLLQSWSHMQQEAVAVVAEIDFAIDVLFVTELILRFVASPRRLYFLLSPFNVIDLLAVAPPLALRLACGIGSAFEQDEQDPITAPRFVLLCYVPVFRLLKTLRRFKKFHLLLHAFELAFDALPVLLFVMAIITLVFSSLIYLVEPRDNIPTLGRAIWLTIVTMATVGYGDVTPKSPAGSCVVGFLVVGSALYMAVPLALIGNAFTTVWARRDEVLLIQAVRDKMCKYGYTALDMPLLFRNYNLTGEGSLVLEDFRNMVLDMRVGLQEDKIVDLFNLLDKETLGKITDRKFVRTIFPKGYAETFAPPPQRRKEHTPSLARGLSNLRKGLKMASNGAGSDGGSLVETGDSEAASVKVTDATAP